MSINNAETWPRPLLNTTCDSEQNAEGRVGRGEASKHFSLAGNYLFMRVVYPGLFLLRYLISLHLASEAVSDEVAGIENQI